MQGKFTHARLEFDVYLEPLAAQAGEVVLASLDVRSATGQAGFNLWRKVDETFLSEETSTPTYFTAPELSTGRWAHVVLDYRIGATFDHAIDDAGGSRSATNVDLGNAPTFTLLIGLTSFDGPNPAVRAYYDNIVYDLD